MPSCVNSGYQARKQHAKNKHDAHTWQLRTGTPWQSRQHVAMWLCYLCIIPQLAAGAPPQYEPRLWNRSCNYTVSNVPAGVFFGRSSSNNDSSDSSSEQPLFPISPGYRVEADDDGSTPAVQAACFGPGQRINHTLVAAGLKMPCGYDVQAGLVSYWEEAVCELALRSNCYCYALNTQSHGGYCIPGYNTQGDIDVDFSDCRDPLYKVQLDGGRPATRQEVYSKQQPGRGHYIALAVYPGKDFHFFRRDAEGWWSQKRGDTWVTNTYSNGSLVLDVEDEDILGGYRQFCGYFHIDPDTHDAGDSRWTYSSMPHRLKEAAARGYTVSSTPLPHPSAGWMRLNYPYLLFGLDAAVFESGERQLPWQSNENKVLKEAGGRQSRTKQERASRSSSSSSGSLAPHWLSHVQHRKTVLERDRAARRHFSSFAQRKMV